jgi:hypothetical protein
MLRTRNYYAAQGFERAYQWACFDDVPFAIPPQPLARSTLALITTASLERRAPLDPRRVASGSTDRPPPRLWAEDLQWDKRATHMEDRSSYFPVDDLHERVAAGALGALTSRFHCAPTEFSQRRTLEVDAPEILRRCREDGADIALLVPV